MPNWSAELLRLARLIEDSHTPREDGLIEIDRDTRGEIALFLDQLNEEDWIDLKRISCVTTYLLAERYGIGRLISALMHVDMVSERRYGR